MAITFPTNPAGQSPANTFSPSSTPVANSANGNTYIWNGTAWIAQSTNSGSYVETGGDTMTGPLRFAGSNSGYAELRAEPNAGEAVFTFPTTGGVLATTTSGSGGSGDGSGSGADAWAKFDGSDGSVLASQNIASITRTSTGVYAVTFTTPMPSSEYSIVFGNTGSGSFVQQARTQTANGFNIRNYQTDTVDLVDAGALSFAVFATNAIPPSGTTGTDAWGSWNNTDGALKASYNIASVTRTATGVYEVTFITPMPTANYSANATAQSTSRKASVTGKTVSGFNVDIASNGSTTRQDASFDFSVNATNAQLPNTVTQEQIEAAINNPGVSAWGTVNSDGTKGAPGLNYTSAKNGGTGLYRVTFDTPMPNNQYSVQLTGTSGAVPAGAAIQTARTDGFDFVTYNSSTGAVADVATSFTVLATNALPPRGTTGADSWVEFDGTSAVGTDCTINASFNVDRVEHPATGTYTVYFTTPMPTASYATFNNANVNLNTNNVTTVSPAGTANAVDSYTIVCAAGSTSTALDCAYVNSLVHCTNAQLPDTVTQEQIDQAVSGRYQQGAWTGVLIGSSSGITTVTTGQYFWSRIGNQVFIDFSMAGADKTTSGDATLEGLPYTASSVITQYIGHVGDRQGINFGSGYDDIYVRINSGAGDQSKIQIMQKGPSIHGQMNTAGGNLTTGIVIRGHISYRTNDTTWVPINGATVD